MYGVIREYELKPGTFENVVAKVREEFLPLIQRAPGYIGYTLTQIGADRAVTVSTFEHRTQAEESTKTAATWVTGPIGAAFVGKPRVTQGELVVFEIDERTTPGYGVMRRIEAKSESVASMTERVRKELVPILAAMPGFARYAMMIESSNGIGATLTAFADRAKAEAANERALAWIEENVAKELIKPVEVVAGDIRITHRRAPVAAR